MGCARYEVVLVDVKRMTEQRREWTPADLVHSVPWLKRMNARGHDVFIAPAGENGLVLLDGLSERMLDAIHKKGFEPAATIQTAPGRVQAWIKLSDRPLPAEVHKHAIKGLKREFEREAIDVRRRMHGRLAGFTCEAEGDVTRRFALVRDASATIARQASRYLEAVHKALAERAKERPSRALEEKSKLHHKQRGPSR